MFVRRKENIRRRSRRKTYKSPAASTRPYPCNWESPSSPASPRSYRRRCGEKCESIIYYLTHNWYTKRRQITCRGRLTCCIKLYRASICDPMARAASPPRRTPSDPILTYNHTMTANEESKSVIYLFVKNKMVTKQFPLRNKICALWEISQKEKYRWSNYYKKFMMQIMQNRHFSTILHHSHKM